MSAADVARIVAQHREAVRSQWTDQQLWYAGLAVVIGCPLIGLVIGLAFWGWPQ